MFYAAVSVLGSENLCCEGRLCLCAWLLAGQSLVGSLSCLHVLQQERFTCLPGRQPRPRLWTTRMARSRSDTPPRRSASMRCTSSTWVATFLVSQVPRLCRPAPQASRSQGVKPWEAVVSHPVRCRAVLGGRFGDAVWASLQNQAACNPSRSG